MLPTRGRVKKYNHLHLLRDTWRVTQERCRASGEAREAPQILMGASASSGSRRRRWWLIEDRPPPPSSEIFKVTPNSSIWTSLCCLKPSRQPSRRSGHGSCCMPLYPHGRPDVSGPCRSPEPRLPRSRAAWGGRERPRSLPAACAYPPNPSERSHLRCLRYGIRPPRVASRETARAGTNRQGAARNRLRPKPQGLDERTQARVPAIAI